VELLCVVEVEVGCDEFVFEVCKRSVVFFVFSFGVCVCSVVDLF
jgi:hypothetical protein